MYTDKINIHYCEKDDYCDDSYINFIYFSSNLDTKYFTFKHFTLCLRKIMSIINIITRVYIFTFSIGNVFCFHCVPELSFSYILGKYAYYF